MPLEQLLAACHSGLHSSHGSPHFQVNPEIRKQNGLSAVTFISGRSKVKTVRLAVWSARIGPWTKPRTRSCLDISGPSYPSLVPQVDGIGNDLGGIRPYELRVPLATNTGWNLRDAPWNTGEHAKTGEDALTSYLGTYIPLPRNEAERRAAGDPRPSVEALYGTKDRFLARVREAAAQSVFEGVLLQRDVPLVEHRASERWDWVMGPRTNVQPIISVSSN
jgi:hypothetical protein